MRPNKNTYPPIPITRKALDTANAQKKEWVAWAIYPVAIGAVMADT